MRRAQGERAASIAPGVLPPPVGRGSRVAVVAPSGPMLASALAPGLAPLQEAGLEVVVAAELGARRAVNGYLAGDDAVRLAELVAALDDDSIDAIVCVRGGYGAMRLLEGLDAAHAARGRPWRPRRLSGFSDITALHAWLLHRLGWASVHAAMPFNFGLAAGTEPDVERSAQELLAALFAESPALGLAPAPQLVTVVPGVARGVLTGGNLSLVEALYRSAALPTLAGALLFVEDVGEVRYRLDRLVTALRLRGAAREVAGVVVGDFAGAGTTADEAASHVAGLFADWGVPVVRGLDSGHRHPHRALWSGWPHELDAGLGQLRPLAPSEVP